MAEGSDQVSNVAYLDAFDRFARQLRNSTAALAHELQGHALTITVVAPAGRKVLTLSPRGAVRIEAEAAEADFIVAGTNKQVLDVLHGRISLGSALLAGTIQYGAAAPSLATLDRVVRLALEKTDGAG